MSRFTLSTRWWSIFFSNFKWSSEWHVKKYCIHFLLNVWELLEIRTIWEVISRTISCIETCPSLLNISIYVISDCSCSSVKSCCTLRVIRLETAPSSRRRNVDFDTSYFFLTVRIEGFDESFNSISTADHNWVGATSKILTPAPPVHYFIPTSRSSMHNTEHSLYEWMTINWLVRNYSSRVSSSTSSSTKAVSYTFSTSIDSC